MNNRKKKSIVIGLLILLIAGIVVYSKVKTNKLDIDYAKVEQIEFRGISNTSFDNIVDNKNDISRIVNFLNSLTLKRSNQDAIKGWEYYFEIKGEEDYIITLIGDRISINKKWYEIDENNLVDFRKIVDEIGINKLNEVTIYESSETLGETLKKGAVLEIKDEEGLQLVCNLIDNAVKIDGKLDIKTPKYICNLNYYNSMQSIYFDINKNEHGEYYGMFIKEGATETGYNIANGDMEAFILKYNKTLNE